MEITSLSRQESGRLVLSLLFLAAWEAGSGQLHYSIAEEAKHGTFVGRIAQDLGLELEDLVPRLFRVASKGRADLLEVNLQNGILFVNSRIDREELCGRSAECSIHLEVIVERPLQVFHVEVEVKDINDNPPMFKASPKNLFIAESRPLDTRFPLEGASDADIGANAVLTYRLSPSEYFSLEKPSDHERVKGLGLVLRKLLDREEAPELTLLLTATDGGKPELTGTVELFITVLDANDNAPVFDRALYTVTIPENIPNGTIIMKLNASDLDEGSNADIMYLLSADTSPTVKSKFHIDPITGQIMVKGFIDFEESKSYELLIEGIDKGQLPLSGHCRVIVEVEDTNDNVPDLEFKSLSLPIREDAPLGSVIALISVSDRDSGINGQVTCSLTPNVPFKLVSTFKNYYSLVLDSALDRESISDYTVVVTARDGAAPPTVLVSLVDSGQAPKASSRAMVGAAGPESTLVDVNVYLIIAICAVSSLLVLTLLLYTALRCSAPPPEGACGPGKPTLVCSSAVGSWSYSQQRRSQRVCSGEGPPKTDLMAFSPSLPDSRDREDQGQTTGDSFPKKGNPGIRRLLFWLLLLAAWEEGGGQLHYSVLEEAKHGTFVGRIAQDLGLELEDLVPRLFRVASKGRADLLEVNLQNGILFVNSRIDREELCGRSAECSIHLEVIVERPLQVFHVDVEVKDINDNPPVFSRQEQRLFILESRMPDSRFPLEGASDLDIGANAELRYKLSPNEYFDLDVKTNEEESNFLELVLKSSLDREDTQEHSLFLTAIDGGKPELTGTVQLLIRVLDANDNAPEFDKSIYNVRLLENTPNGTLVIKLNASDADEGINKEIAYFFSKLVFDYVKSKFILNSYNGEIKVKGELDYEDRNIYEIGIDAVDRSTFPLTGHCKVIVKLVDVNDNTPTMTINSLFLPVKEDAPLGTVVALISVSDRDSGANGQVTCSLTPNVPFKLVSTYKNYYSLVLDSALDRESISDYTVVVTARDGGSPSLWATASVSVEPARTATSTVLVSLVDSGQAPKASSRAMVGAAGPESTLVDVNVYLIIAICAVSSLLVLTLLLYTALRCSAPPPEGACGPGKPTLVCSSAVGSWSYSQQRRSQRVCSGEGPPKTDLMAFSPSLPHGPTSADNVSLKKSYDLHF
ncbi:Protocadherin alpha-5 [Tupaia chinensis]|uniref:Protocadherin alpha-5 n=1 Tax=Tupaia chinensis TaxID=246437 RepID=L9JU87_TUPCH|nr:Protocadherin alpha-5 [Tupaia chinensis]